MSNIRLSFIIPVYQVAKYLDQCLDSISSQKLKDMEVWVIDDGSTDGTAEICDRWAEKDCRFKVLHISNQGISVARNLGMSKASGEWICFVDGDDWIERDFTEKLIFDHYTDSDIVLFGSSYVNEDGEIQVREDITKTGLISKAVNDHIISRILDIYIAPINTEIDNLNYRAAWGKMYRADFLRKNHLQFVPGIRMGEDMVLNLEAFLCCPQVYGSSITEYSYRLNSLSLSNKYNDAVTDAYQGRNRELKNVLLKYQRINDFQDAVYALYIDDLLNCIRIDYCHLDNPFPFSYRKAKFINQCNLYDYDKALKETDLSYVIGSNKYLIRFVQMKCFFAVNAFVKMRSWYKKVKMLFQ